MRLITADGTPPSLARVDDPTQPPLRVALVQHRWREDADELATVLDEAVGQAAQAGAEIVFLPEITLLRYPADVLPTEAPGPGAESLDDGPTVAAFTILETRTMVTGEDSALIAYRVRFRAPEGAEPITWMVSSLWRRTADGSLVNVFSQDTPG